MTNELTIASALATAEEALPRVRADLLRAINLSPSRTSERLNLSPDLMVRAAQIYADQLDLCKYLVMARRTSVDLVARQIITDSFMREPRLTQGQKRFLEVAQLLGWNL